MPVVMHSGAISHAETTSTMVLRSQVRGDQIFAAMPEVESQPETEVAPDVEHLAEVEIEITVRVIDEDLGIAGPENAEKSFTTFFIIRNKCSSEQMVRGTKGPGFIRSRERNFPGMNGPRTIRSQERKFHRGNK